MVGDTDRSSLPTLRGVGVGRLLVWVLWASSTAFVLGALAYTLPAIAAGRVSGDEPLGIAFFAAVPVVLAAVGAVVAGRRPAHPIGWLLLVSGWLFAVSAFASGYAQHGPVGTESVRAWASVLGDIAFFPAFVLVGLVLPLVFPDGRLPSRRWRVVGWGIAAATVAEAVSIPLRSLAATDSGAGVAQLARMLEGVASLMFPVLLAAIAVAVVLRFVRARGMARLQFKWVALPAVLFFTFVALNESGVVAGTGAEVLLTVLLIAGFGGLPVGVGVAVLRYRLYAIDRIISRTLAYGLLTVVIVAVYTGGVVGLGAAVRAATGQTSSDVVVAASTLVAAALFQPARRRIQAAVERRFNRTRYDARRTVGAFAHRLRDEVDADALLADLRTVVVATVQPAGVSLWLRPAETDDGAGTASPRGAPR